MEVSVIMPARNAAQHIQRSVASVLDQSVAPIEIIVVDDASTDDTVERVRELDAAGLRLIRRRSAGAAGYAARNAGVEAATTPWVAFLDSDDEWLPNHLEALKDLSQRFPEATLLSTSWRVVGARQQSRSNHYAQRYGSTGPHSLSARVFVSRWATGRAPAWTSATCVRTDVLRRAGGFPESRCVRGGDVDTWLRVVLAGGRAAYSPNVTSIYHRDVEGSVTRNLNPQVKHCTSETISEAIRSTRSIRLRFGLKRLANAHKKDPIRKRARYGVLVWDDVRLLYPFASPVFFLFACVLLVVPTRTYRRLLTIRDRAVRVRGQS